MQLYEFVRPSSPERCVAISDITRERPATNLKGLSLGPLPTIWG